MIHCRIHFLFELDSLRRYLGGQNLPKIRRVTLRGGALVWAFLDRLGNRSGRSAAFASPGSSRADLVAQNRKSTPAENSN